MKGKNPLFTSLTREAFKNLTTNPVRTSVLSSFLATLLIVVVLAETTETSAVRRYEAQLRQSGFNSLLVRPTPDLPAVLKVGDCTSLADIDGVNGASWFSQPTTTSAISPNGVSQRITTFGGEVVAVMSVIGDESFQSWKGAQVFTDRNSPASSSRAKGEYQLELFSLDRKDQVDAISLSLLSFGGAFDGQMIAAGYASAETEVAGCLLLAQESARDLAKRSVETTLPPTSGYSTTWVLPNATAQEPPLSVFERRSTRDLWIYSVAVFGGLWAFSLRLRRNDFAVYAVCGIRGASAAIIASVEAAVVCGLGATLGIGILALGYSAQTADLEALGVGVLAGQRFFLASVVFSLALACQFALATSLSTVAALKER